MVESIAWQGETRKWETSLLSHHNRGVDICRGEGTAYFSVTQWAATFQPVLYPRQRGAWGRLLPP